MIKSIIVEDDPIYSKQLYDLIKSADKDINVVSICRNVSDAVQCVKENKPELIFLDIELQGQETGFDLLKQIDYIDYSVIFTTSHVDDNISGIRINGIGFIVKPYMLGELIDLIEKYLKNKKKEIEKVKVIKGNLQASDPNNWYIFIEYGSESFKLMLNNIMYCKSEDPNTYFYINNPIETRESLISSHSIREFEKFFENTNIIRTHNRYLVNTRYIKKYIKGNGGTVILNNNIELPVSKTYKNSFLTSFGINN